jgi:hypothetical protein
MVIGHPSMTFSITYQYLHQKHNRMTTYTTETAAGHIVNL